MRRVYIIASGSLAKNGALGELQRALGSKVAGTRVGMKGHTMMSEVLEIIHDARKVGADLLVTLGGGTLSDGAKLVSFVGWGFQISMLSDPTD